MIPPAHNHQAGNVAGLIVKHIGDQQPGLPNAVLNVCVCLGKDKLTKLKS